MELPAVELDDQPFGLEIGVRLVAGDDRVDPRAREAVARAEGEEGVLELRARGAVGGGCEGLKAFARVAVEELGQLRSREVVGPQCVVDGAGEGGGAELRRGVEEGPRRGGDTNTQVSRDVPTLKSARNVDGDPSWPAITLDGYVEAGRPALPESP